MLVLKLQSPIWLKDPSFCSGVLRGGAGDLIWWHNFFFFQMVSYSTGDEGGRKMKEKRYFLLCQPVEIWLSFPNDYLFLQQSHKALLYLWISSVDFLWGQHIKRTAFVILLTCLTSSKYLVWAVWSYLKSISPATVSCCWKLLQLMAP